MHDEVSETENIRKNLAIERMIIGGCDILLDVNQVFVRQGTIRGCSNLPQRRPLERVAESETPVPTMLLGHLCSPSLSLQLIATECTHIGHAQKPNEHMANGLLAIICILQWGTM